MITATPRNLVNHMVVVCASSKKHVIYTIECNAEIKSPQFAVHLPLIWSRNFVHCQWKNKKHQFTVLIPGSRYNHHHHQYPLYSLLQVRRIRMNSNFKASSLKMKTYQTTFASSSLIMLSALQFVLCRIKGILKQRVRAYLQRMWRQELMMES